MRGEYFLKAINDVNSKYIEEAREKTMKKKFNFKPIIAVAACAVFALAAIPVANHFANNNLVDGGTTAGTVAPVPGDEVNFTVYERDFHDGVESLAMGNHKIEITLNSKRESYYDQEKKGTRKIITFNGATCNGKYEKSLAKTDYNEAVDRYIGNSNGKEVIFTINQVTGKCEYFRFNSSNVDKTVKLTRDELYEIAYANFLSGGYTEDPENYQLSDENSNGSAGYWFQFTRFVNGIETSEYVRIGLRNNGDFYWYMGNRVGEMKNVDLSRINVDKLYSAMEEKFKAIYSDAYVSFERKGIVYTKLTDGTYVFNCATYANVMNNKEKLVSDKCYLTVVMN